MAVTYNSDILKKKKTVKIFNFRFVSKCRHLDATLNVNAILIYYFFKKRFTGIISAVVKMEILIKASKKPLSELFVIYFIIK